MARVFVWLAGIVAFGGFNFWLGGHTEPLSGAEIAELLEKDLGDRASGAQADDFRQNIQRLAAGDDGRAFFMVNLETLRKGSDAEAADMAYGKAILPMLLQQGSFPVFIGRRSGLLFGEAGESLDRVAIVRYRSLRDFVAFATSDEMSKAAPHKWASLEHTEVFPVRSVLVTWPYRILGLIFILVLVLLLDRLFSRR